MMKRGWQWDATPVPDISVADLDAESIRMFREYAKEAKRLEEGFLAYGDEALLDKLGLISNGMLTIAAILLFHAHPEKWVVGAYTKIAYFANDADIVFQDIVSGPLISQPDKTVDLIYSKYLRAAITYDGIRRVESFPFSRAAMREAVLNAIANKHYEQGAPVQIRVYDDHILMFNDGSLPENWTVDTLFEPHKSVPYNPLIAHVYFMAGFIESWGRGIEKMVRSCAEDGIPSPVFDVSSGDIKLTFNTVPERVMHLRVDVPGSINDNYPGQDDESFVIDTVIEKHREQYGAILTQIEHNPEITIKGIAGALKLNERLVSRRIRALKDLSVLQRIGPDRGGTWKIR
jgi:ATP-dependent DNA helicase RecG